MHTLRGGPELDDVDGLRRLLGQRLREERTKKRDAVRTFLRPRYSQTGIAEQVGVDPTVVSRWETGQREPDLSKLAKIAAAIGVSPGVLLSDIDAVVEKSARSQRKGERRTGG